MSQGDFQSQVNTAQAPAVEGDFCDKNPRYSFDAGPGGLVAGVAGAIVGRFAWVEPPLDADGTPSVVNNFGNGQVAGFIHREQQGLITDYLASSGMKVQPGFQTTLMIGGGFWALNTGNTPALPGQKAYANFADGKVTFAATGSPSNGGTSTASTIAPQTFSVTATIAGDVMNVTAVGSGTVVPSAPISGSGVISGTTVVSQISGTPGGVGEYLVSVGEQTVSTPVTVSGSYGLLTVGGTVAGTFGVGQTVTGSGISDTYITALGTGLGQAGTYIVNKTQTVNSQAINTASNVETKWYARSQGLPGELVKISDQPLG
jgi:hypothetical protein